MTRVPGEQLSACGSGLVQTPISEQGLVVGRKRHHRTSHSRVAARAAPFTIKLECIFVDIVAELREPSSVLGRLLTRACLTPEQMHLEIAKEVWQAYEFARLLSFAELAP